MNGTAAWGTTVLACLLLTTGVIPTPSVAGIDDGLIAYWSFDDCRADDSSGYRRHGTIQGGMECVDSPLQGKALRFQGTGEFEPTGDHVRLPSIDFPSPREFSICLRVNEQVLEHSHGEAYINWGWSSWGEWVVIGRFLDNDGDNLWFSTGGESPIKVPFDAESDQNRYVHYCLVHGSDGFTEGY
jgi:hypothetical protein